MEIVHFDSAQEFRDRTLPFLLAREAEHGLLTSAVLGVDQLPTNALAAILVDNSRTIGVALRLGTRLIVSRVDDRRGIGLLADSVSSDRATIITGAVATVEAIRAKRAKPPTFTMAQRIYAATAVDPPTDAPAGARRPLVASDANLLIDAHLDLSASLGAVESREHAEAHIDQLFELGKLFVWETPAGEPVCCAGTAGPTVHGIRLNYVYTRPEFRGRGYASALVADLTQSLLAIGRSFVFLHADLANPTANAIYQRMGYEAIADFTMLRYGS